MNGKRLKRLREEKGLTQKDLAEKLLLTPKAISFYELGSREPSGDALIRMAHILGTTTDYLLGNSTTKEADQKVGRGVRIPVLGRVVAGIPIEAVEEILDYESWTTKKLHRSLPPRVNFLHYKSRGIQCYQN